MSRLNVRWRLALWYGALLAMILAGYGSLIFFLMYDNLLERTDIELAEELDELAIEIRLAQNTAQLQRQLNDRFLRHSTFDFQVVGVGGALLFRSERLTSDSQLLERGVPTRSENQTALLGALGKSRVAFRAVDRPDGQYLVHSVAPLKPNDEETSELLVILLSSGPPIVFLGLLGGYWLARRALRPVDEMVHAAEAITSMHLERRIEVQNPDDEIGHLALTLNRMIGRLESAVERMRQFTTDAAHELRTPLAVLKIEAEVALMSERSAEEYQRVINGTVREADRLAHIAGQLLQLCRQEDFVAAQSEEVPLDALFSDVVDQLRVAATQSGVALIAKPFPQCTIRGDDVRLSQLLFNVIENAIKYTPRGGRVELTLTTSPETVTISIADTGIGIAPSDLVHIFDRFFRVDPSRNQMTGGAGLGLAISKSIAEAHGGSLTVESKVGKGSCFRIVLPCEPSRSGKSDSRLRSHWMF